MHANNANTLLKSLTLKACYQMKQGSVLDPANWPVADDAKEEIVSMAASRMVMHQIVLPAEVDSLGICFGGQVSTLPLAGLQAFHVLGTSRALAWVPESQILLALTAGLWHRFFIANTLDSIGDIHHFHSPHTHPVSGSW